MKYYVYVSDTKVNMLYEQIPNRAKDKISTELKIDLKFISTTFSEKAEERSRFAKLDIVTEYLRKNEPVGTVDEPDSYFQGTMPFRWGLAESAIGSMVYFGGVTDRTYLGLGGSPKHVIGEIGPSDISKAVDKYYRSYSSAPPILQILISLVNNNKELGLVPKTRRELNHVELITRNMDGPLQNLEFLAKQLMLGKNSRGKSILLGSPIYVSLT